jgi:hypothetical protein
MGRAWPRSALALPAAVFVAAALAFFAGTKPAPVSWNEYARLATVESLVERGTLKIGRSPLAARTRDKVLIDGSYYADKPPLLQVLAVPPYAALHAAGLSLASNDAYRPLTFLLVGLPAAGLLAFVAAFTRRHTGSVGAALGLAILLGACTLAWPYSLVFNNHMPAAIALLAAFAAVPPGPSTAGPARLLGAGALAGLAVGCELLAALPALALAVLVGARFRRGLLWFAAGGLAVSAVTVIADLATWGHWLPPYFATRGYRYAGSPYGQSVAGLIAPRNRLLNVASGTLGEQGVIAHSPAILLALVALVRVLRERSHPFRGHALAAAAGALAFAACVFVVSGAHGGQSYGNRHFLAVVPLLFFFVPLASRLPRSPLALAVIALLGLVGFVSAARGARDPWTAVPPPLYVEVRGPRLCNGLTQACWPTASP